MFTSEICFDPGPFRNSFIRKLFFCYNHMRNTLIVDPNGLEYFVDPNFQSSKMKWCGVWDNVVIENKNEIQFIDPASVN